MATYIQGILPVVQTALTEDGKLDTESLAHQIEF
jgi:dihydrodipicolinate synthase/N-acetylneuraminate lyase